jgi:archaellum component FlaC
MKKEVKTKKVTIDKLAVMMNDSFEVLRKDIAGVDEKVGNVEKEIKGVKNQLEGTNKRIDDFVVTRVKYEDHNKLKTRVDFIEEKLEIKK